MEYESHMKIGFLKKQNRREILTIIVPFHLILKLGCHMNISRHKWHGQVYTARNSRARI